ncbi:MAG TPA: hypothetical protein VIV60_06110, partial [Polyangiaceae bacterium]
AVCHTDPSGGFLLTQYGRAQTQTLLSTFGRGPAGEEVDRRSQFAFGVPLPDWLNVGVTGRYMYLYMKPQGAPAAGRSVWMQSDARAVANFDRFEIAGSLGYSHEGGLPASITSRPKDNLVSREFWVGYSFDEDRNNRLRVGRMYLPFGMRTIDHTLYVRNATQTDLDSQQQYGASFFHQGESYRAEVMAIAGNYQMRPDSYRRRGYSAYLEYAVLPRMGLGFSSFATYQKTDELHDVVGSLIRGAHGPYMRWAPISSLALLSEWDLLHTFATGGGDPIFGIAGLIQADWEFVRGLHAVVTPELYVPNLGGNNSVTGYRGWLTMAWYAYPHIDFRADGIVASEPNRGKYTMALGQVHVSL